MLLVRHYFTLLIAGVTLWLLDQNYCTLLHNLPFGLPNPQFHSWWHILTGLSHHYGIQFIIGVRLKNEGKGMPNTKWYCGLLPVTVADVKPLM
jgi:dihydroceramidase